MAWSLWVACMVSPLDRLRGSPGPVGLAGREQSRQIVLEQVTDALDRDVRGRVRGQRLGVVGVVPLAWENGRQAGSPGLLHGAQKAQLVVHQDIVAGRVMLL